MSSQMALTFSIVGKEVLPKHAARKFAFICLIAKYMRSSTFPLASAFRQLTFPYSRMLLCTSTSSTHAREGRPTTPRICSSSSFTLRSTCMHICPFLVLRIHPERTDFASESLNTPSILYFFPVQYRRDALDQQQHVCDFCSF